MHTRAITSAAPGTTRATFRMAAISWVTVSWVATASSNTVESTQRFLRPAKIPVCAITSATAFEHPVRALRGRDPLPPVHQRGRVEAHLHQRPAARHLPPDIELQRIRRLGIGQVIQLLQHQHGPDQVRRQRRPARARAEQVRGETTGEQLAAVLCEEGEHAARRDQVPGQVTGVPQITISPRDTLHEKIISGTRTPCRQQRRNRARRLFSGVLAAPGRVSRRCRG